MKPVSTFILATLLLGAARLPADSPPPAAGPPVSLPEQKFREGLHAEEAQQDMDAAAKAYRSIVESWDRDRETVSSALFRLGEVCRKQNRPKDAAECFRRVAREFPDREPLARLARENLAALGEPLPEVPPAAVPGAADPEQDKALARLIELEKQSPDLILKPDNGLKKNGVISYDEAAEAGYIRVVQWYLAHGASVDATPSKACPLVLAAGFGRLALVEFLLEKGAKVDGAKSSPSPLSAAAANGHLGVVRCLLARHEAEDKKKEKPDRSWLNVIAGAVDNGHQAVVEYLLSQKAAPLGLMDAVENGNAPIVKMLLAAGADPNLPVVVYDKSMERVRKLDRSGHAMRPVQNGTSNYVPGLGIIPAGLPTAYWGYGQFKSRNVQKTPGSNQMGQQSQAEYPPQRDNFAPLHIATARGNAEIVTLLLEHKATADVKSTLGSTPLELACLMGKSGAAQLLLKAGASPSHETPGGMRLVDLALMHRDEKLYNALRAHGASVAGRSPCGKSPLSMIGSNGGWHLDGDNGHLKWVQRLLADGADPNGDSEFRPVNQAASLRSVELIRLLREKGADFTPEKSGADAPVPLAAKDFSAEALPAIRALLEAGADINGVSSVSEMPASWSGAQFVNRRSPLVDHVIAAMPSAALLDEVLKLKPLTTRDQVHTATVVQEVATQELAGIEAAKTSPPPASNRPPGSGREPMSEETARNIIRSAPAVITRLWDYTFREQNSGWRGRVWFQTFVPGRAGERQLLSFRPASPGAEPLSLLDAIIHAFGLGTQDDRFSYASWKTVPVPDFSRLTIVRCDPNTGAPAARETVDFAGLVAKGDAAAMPVLQPGDLIEGFAPSLPAETTSQGAPVPSRHGKPGSSVRSWREFDEALATGIQAMAARPSVTVKVGTREQQFVLHPWLEGFRRDASSSVLAIEPKLSRLIRYLPKPSFFYRLNAVRFIPKSGAPQTFDCSGANPPDGDPTIRDGDRVEIDALPDNDPAVTARMKQGLFIRGEDTEFFSEIVHDPATPAFEWSDHVKGEVIRYWVARSDSLVPFSRPSRARVIAGEPDGPWGDALVLPAADRDAENIWELPQTSVSGSFTFRSNDGKSAAFAVLVNQLYASQGPDGLRLIPDVVGLNSFTLADFIPHLTANDVFSPPTTHEWGTWTLYRKGKEEPLASFTPGKPLPFIVLEPDDTIELRADDAAAARQPRSGVSSSDSRNPLGWSGGTRGLFSTPGNRGIPAALTPANGARRRVQLPVPAPVPLPQQ